MESWAETWGYGHTHIWIFTLPPLIPIISGTGRNPDGNVQNGRVAGLGTDVVEWEGVLSGHGTWTADTQPQSTIYTHNFWLECRGNRFTSVYHLVVSSPIWHHQLQTLVRMTSPIQNTQAFMLYYIMWALVSRWYNQSQTPRLVCYQERWAWASW